MSTRELFQQVVLFQKFCDLTYGVAPCNAQLGVTGEHKCYNTLATCQDRANYIASDLELNFCKQNENMPRDEGVLIPSVVSVSTNPTTLNVAASSVDQGPLGRRSSVKITLSDHPYHDRLVDKYWAERAFDASQQSTFWAKWLARNPYYKGSSIRIIERDLAGILPQRARRYIVDRIEYASSGRITITAKDILSPLSEALCPQQSTGVLGGPLGESTPTMIVTNPDEYPPFGIVRIDDEIMAYTLTGPVMSFTRAYAGTTAEEHDEGAPVQWCAFFNNRVDVVLEDLLVNFGGIDPSFVNVGAQWTAETDKWGTAYQLQTIISEPTKVSTLVGEVLEQCSCSLWWDEVQQLIPFRFVRPVDISTETIASLNGDQHIKINSVNVRPRPEQRVDEVWFYYGMQNFAGELNKASTYARVRVTVAAQAQQNFAEENPAIRQIFSRWLEAGSLGAVVTTSTRILQRLSDMPRDISFALDAKDRDIWTGDVVQLTVRALIDFNGAPLPTLLQVTSAEDVEEGHSINYIAQLFGLSQRTAFITPNDYPVYSLATDAQKLNGAWISENTGLMPNGDPGYLLS